MTDDSSDLLIEPKTAGSPLKAQVHFRANDHTAGITESTKDAAHPVPSGSIVTAPPSM